MVKGKQLLAIQEYCKKLFGNDASGHDYYHLKRVARLATEIADEEGADSFICAAGAWLHDIGDHKLFSNPEKALANLDNFLTSINVPEQEKKDIHLAIENISFSKGKVPQTLEGKIIQDADRIDAIGAIGIARTFAYGGASGQLMYHDEKKEGTSVHHFYDKILILKETLHTKAAKELAKQRHAFVVNYLKQFFKEWN